MKFVFVLFVGFASSLVLANAELEAKKQKMEERSEEASADIGRGARKAGRSIKDKSCELVNGKMECAAQRAKHGIQNGADKVEDAID